MTPLGDRSESKDRFGPPIFLSSHGCERTRRWRAESASFDAVRQCQRIRLAPRLSRDQLNRV